MRVAAPSSSPSRRARSRGSTEDVSIDDYDALVIPGGVGNPDTMRRDKNAVRFVREFCEAGKPLAAICHAPWMLVEADVARDRRLTSFWSIKTDVENAGGNWGRRGGRRRRQHRHEPLSRRPAGVQPGAGGALREGSGRSSCQVVAVEAAPLDETPFG